jgi:hypothetical protein
VTDTRHACKERAGTDGVSPSTPARSLPGAAPAAGSSGTPVVSDLLDRAVQHIFGAGLLLTSAAHRSTPAVVASIEEAIGDLEEALRYIRADVPGSATDPACASFSEVRPSR